MSKDTTTTEQEIWNKAIDLCIAISTEFEYFPVEDINKEMEKLKTQTTDHDTNKQTQ
jgi:hypothetical protein